MPKFRIIIIYLAFFLSVFIVLDNIQKLMSVYNKKNIKYDIIDTTFNQKNNIIFGKEYEIIVNRYKDNNDLKTIAEDLINESKDVQKLKYILLNFCIYECPEGNLPHYQIYIDDFNLSKDKYEIDQRVKIPDSVKQIN